MATRPMKFRWQMIRVFPSNLSTSTVCFADEDLPLDADGAEILSETFNVLSLKEMKLQAISNAAGGAAGEEPDEEERIATMTKAVLQAAQKKVVSQVSKAVKGAGQSRVTGAQTPPAVVHRSRRRPS